MDDYAPKRDYALTTTTTSTSSPTSHTRDSVSKLTTHTESKVFEMAESSKHEGETSIFKEKSLPKSHDILTCTVKNPPYSYAHLTLVTSSTQPESLDELQVKSYCTNALRQFLGLTGQAMSLDILKVQGREAWVRIPRGDLGSFAAAITAYKGIVEDGVERVLRLKQCSDYLGAMVGSDGQDRIWNS